jgi:hypothetical protein
MPTLSRQPPAPNVIELDKDGLDLVTLVACDLAQAYVFVGFDRHSLRVRWTQRAPGSFNDPRGHHDHDGRNGLWRAHLEPPFRDLLDRFEPRTLPTFRTE